MTTSPTLKTLSRFTKTEPDACPAVGRVPARSGERFNGAQEQTGGFLPARPTATDAAFLRVLFLTGDGAQADGLAATLAAAGYAVEPEWVSDGPGLLARLPGEPDLIVAEAVLPGVDLPALLLHLRGEGGVSLVQPPVIVVCGPGEEECAQAALQAGAVDYIWADRPGRLGHAAAQALERGRASSFASAPPFSGWSAGEQANRQNERLLQRLGVLAQEVGVSDDLQVIYRSLSRFVHASVPCSGLFISHFDPERQERICRYAWSEGQEEDADALPPMPMNDSPHSRAILSGRAVVTHDLDREVPHLPRVDLGMTRDSRRPVSSLAVPMTVMGRVIGGFEVQSVRPNAYTQEHVAALQMAANLTAIATENARHWQRWLRESQETEELKERYRIISELVSDYAYAIRVRENGGYYREWVTGAYSRITGYRPEEVQGPNALQKVLYAEDSPIVAAHLKRVLAGERSVCEYRIRTRQGAVRWLLDFAYPVFEESQRRVVLVLGAAQDITERKQAEEALRASESRLRRAERVAHLGNWEMEIATGQSSWSDEFFRICGFEPNAFTPSSEIGFSLIHPDDRERAAKILGEAIAKHERYAIEKRIVRPDGSVVWVDSKGEVECDAEGKPVRLVGSFQDITERKAVEEALRESRSLLQIAGETARLGGWAVELPDYQVIWSDAVCAIHEMPLGSRLTAQEALAFFLPGWQEKVGRLLRICAQEGIPFDEEMQMVTAKGRPIWVRVTGQAQHGADGRIHRVQGALQDITEHKLAAEEVERLADRLTTILESITDAFFTLDRSWNFIYLNSEAERLLARPREELLGRSVWDEFPEAVGSAFYEQYHRALVENVTAEFEAYYPPLRAWFEVRAYPSDEGLAVYFRDVTERHQAEETLRQRLAELEALYTASASLRAAQVQEEALPVLLDATLAALDTDAGAIWLYDAERNELQAAARSGWFADLGEFPLRPGEGIGGRVFATGCTHVSTEFWADPIARRETRDDAPPGWGGACVPILAGEEAVGVIFVAVPPQRPLAPEQVRLLESLAELTGVTLHRLGLWQALREQARRVQGIMDAAPTGVLLLENDGCILLANPMAERELLVLARLDDSPAPGQRRARRLTHLGGRPLSDLLAAAGQGGATCEIEMDERIFEVMARPMLSGANLSQWVVVLNDVTVERNRQRYLHTQERLATVGQLAAGIAHDFNNILNVITLYAQFLANSSSLSEQGKRQATTIYRQAEHAANLITQILDFSRRASLNLVELDMLLLIQRLKDLLERTLPEHVSVELTHEKRAYIISGDPTRLQQVLMNLAINARDAMPLGGRLHFALSAFHLADGRSAPLPDMTPGHWLRLQVEDSGTGIAPEHMRRIYEPFFTTKEQGKGTGLGLAQVYGIVKQHQGAIDVWSQQGKGTIFTIYLPLLPDRATTTEGVDAMTTSNGQGERILMVEDNPALQDAVADILESVGYEVLLAGDGEEALAVLQAEKGKVHLILTDLVMPKMSGVELRKRVQALYPTLPMLFVSGYAPDDMAHSAGLTEKNYLPKPFSAVDLTTKIEEVLAQSHSEYT